MNNVWLLFLVRTSILKFCSLLEEENMKKTRAPTEIFTVLFSQTKWIADLTFKNC